MEVHEGHRKIAGLRGRTILGAPNFAGLRGRTFETGSATLVKNSLSDTFQVMMS
jgi:hypothetical protein